MAVDTLARRTSMGYSNTYFSENSPVKHTNLSASTVNVTAAAVPPVLEMLEERRLLAATAALDKAGSLVVAGTKGDDELWVSENSKKQIVVTLNGAKKSFARRDVERIIIRSG